MKTARIEIGTILDAEQGGLFRKNVQQALVGMPKELELNCLDLEYIDSTGLGLLTLARTEAQRIGCHIKLVGVRNHPRRVLEMMRFDQLFTIEFADTPPTDTEIN